MPAKATKQLVDVADVRDNVVILKNGSLRMILEVSAINFELRSDEEQSAIVQGFQSFLNSVDFPVQIVIQSRRFMVEDYLAIVQQASQSLTNDLLRVQAGEYMKFVRELSTLSNIMSKKFYIVIPFYVVDAPKASGILDSIKNIFRSSAQIAAIPEDKFQAYQNQLGQRAELVLDGVLAMGLRARPLEQTELVAMFSSLYNPEIRPGTI